MYGTSSQKGRILDINGNILVDNVGIKTIYYNSLDSITTNDQIDIAYKLAGILDINMAKDLNEKKFYEVY